RASPRPRPGPRTPSLRRCRGLPLHVLAEPREPALVAVLLERRAADAVRLAGVDDELRRPPEAAQPLVELLRVDDRHVPVALAAHDQRWRADAFDLVERRDALPQIGRASCR